MTSNVLRANLLFITKLSNDKPNTENVLTFTGSGYSGLVTSSRLSNGSSIVTTGGRFSGDSANLLIRENQVWKQDRQGNSLTWSKPPKRTKRPVEMKKMCRYEATGSLVHRTNIDSVDFISLQLKALCSCRLSSSIQEVVRLKNKIGIHFPRCCILPIFPMFHSSFSSRCLFIAIVVVHCCR